MLSQRIGLLEGRWNGGYLKPMDDSWTIPDEPPYYKVAMARGDIEVAFARLQPVNDVQRQGVAVCAGVKGDVRAGVMITPKSAQGKGLDPAQKGERVFCHVHGG